MIKAVLYIFFPSAFFSIVFLDNMLLHVCAKANGVMNCFHFCKEFSFQYLLKEALNLL